MRLARACGARQCTEEFLWKIAEAVWGLSRNTHREDLKELHRQQYVRISSDGRREVVPQHDYYLDVDYDHHYVTVAAYKSDLRKLEELLLRGGLSRRLADLGLHYWNDLQDVIAAQRLLESAVRENRLDRSSALALTRLYLWIDEPARAKTAIETLRDSIADPDEKAETVLMYADEILYRMNQPAIAARWYAQAAGLATIDRTRGVIAQRAADCAMKTRQFADAMINAGFLDSAAQAYDYVISEAVPRRIDLALLAGCYINLGAAHRDAGRLPGARSSFEHAVRLLAQDLPAATGLAVAAQAGLADCDLFGGGDLALARQRYERARQTGEVAQDAWVGTWGALGLGDLLAGEERWTEAEQIYRSMKLLPESVGGETRFLLGLARSCRRLGKLDDAQMYLARGLARCNRQGYVARQRQFLAEQAKLVFARVAGV